MNWQLSATHLQNNYLLMISLNNTSLKSVLNCIKHWKYSRIAWKTWLLKIKYVKCNCVVFCYASLYTSFVCETIYYKPLCNQIRESEVRQNRLYDCGSFYVLYMNYNRTYVCICQSEILPKMIGVRLIGHIILIVATVSSLLYCCSYMVTWKSSPLNQPFLQVLIQSSQ